jgi:hypothetical protein
MSDLVEPKWQLRVAPLIAKLQLSATLNMNTTFNTEGSAALAKVLQCMAKDLDISNELIKALQEQQRR